jgi:hypothetical protein
MHDDDADSFQRWSKHHETHDRQPEQGAGRPQSIETFECQWRSVLEEISLQYVIQAYRRLDEIASSYAADAGGDGDYFR